MNKIVILDTENTILLEWYCLYITRYDFTVSSLNKLCKTIKSSQDIHDICRYFECDQKTLEDFSYKSYEQIKADLIMYIHTLKEIFKRVTRYKHIYSDIHEIYSIPQYCGRSLPLIPNRKGVRS